MIVAIIYKTIVGDLDLQSLNWPISKKKTILVIHFDRIEKSLQCVIMKMSHNKEKHSIKLYPIFSCLNYGQDC